MRDENIEESERLLAIGDISLFPHNIKCAKTLGCIVYAYESISRAKVAESSRVNT